MAASDYAPIFFKNRLHLAGRPQMSTRPSVLIPKSPESGHGFQIDENPKWSSRSEIHFSRLPSLFGPCIRRGCQRRSIRGRGDRGQ
jgi:hypothetical protein